MNQHYNKALVEATVQKLREEDVKVTSTEVEEVLMNNIETTGNWQQDAQALYEACLRYVEDVEEDDDDDVVSEEDDGNLAQRKAKAEAKVSEVVDNLKVGLNIIPGLGACWARDEEDLEHMKEFVRGALAVQVLQGSCCECLQTMP